VTHEEVCILCGRRHGTNRRTYRTWCEPQAMSPVETNKSMSPRSVPSVSVASQRATPMRSWLRRPRAGRISSFDSRHSMARSC